MLFCERGDYTEESMQELDQYYICQLKYIDECKRLQDGCLAFGLRLTLLECQELYQNKSSEVCASWSNGIEYMSNKEIYDMMVSKYRQLINDRFDRWGMIEHHLRG